MVVVVIVVVVVVVVSVVVVVVAVVIVLASFGVSWEAFGGQLGPPWGIWRRSRPIDAQRVLPRPLKSY